MNHIHNDEQRRAFSIWLRTGRLLTVREDGVELKFNPYHDPRNGQFTFAPGGPRSLGRVVISHRRDRQQALRRDVAPDQTSFADVATRLSNETAAARDEASALSDAVYRPGEATAVLQPAQFSRPPRAVRGSNSRAFEDPMTLEQTFSGLRDAPGGAIIALADNIFDLKGPANAAVSELAQARVRELVKEIKAIDPDWHFASFGFPETVQAQLNQLDGLRFDRAAALFRIKGELQPMQVETLRFIQARTNDAYARGLKRLKAGKLKILLSEEEALGNFIDREVRGDLRERYNLARISWAGAGPVRVNRRENDSSSTELTFRRPDARVGSVAYDMTLTQKTLKTQQIRGFFNTDFKPSQVVIIRPRQLGSNHTYIINRPEVKR